MMRVQIENRSLLLSAILELIINGYKIEVSNRSGDCLYISHPKKEAGLSHWTNDNPIQKISRGDFWWLINCLGD